MRLTVVGCAGSYPGPDSPASCYLLEAPHEGRTYRVVLDLGNGAFGALQRRVDPFDIDAVLLSHLHADHCIDLTAYYVLLKYFPDPPRRRVPVFGPAGTAERMARAYDLPEQPGMTGQFRFETWEPAQPLELGPLRIELSRMAHPVETYAMRIEHDGRVLTYSGDTGPCQGLVETARDADVLLCEASFMERPDNPPELHLTGREAAEHATKAGVRRLVLTHVPPWYDPQQVRAEAAQAYAGPLELAEPGATYDV